MTLAAGCVLALGAANARAQTTQDLKRMSLEELLNVDVTTVSRAPEPTMSVPAAVFVITADDIRRSGAQSIPEALRLAPGVQVARINAGTWAIGMRGFADRLARSMLVLIDGRAVYSPLFAGTYWETQDTLLEDVDRIEVIRGPGGTLWGANAVNGIINIITKPASATAGTLASAGAGSSERGFLGVRYGGRAGEAWNYRVYGKAFDRTSQFHSDGLDFDGLRLGQGGFRADWNPTSRRGVTLQGDVYDARLGERPTVTSYTAPYANTSDLDAPLSGGDLLTRWSDGLGRAGSFQLQAYYSRTSRSELPVTEKRDTADLDFQQRPPRWRGHQITWGAGYRVTSGDIVAVAPTAFFPPRRTDNLFSWFAQDELSVVPRVRVTLGSKFEHNGYSGFEVQPSIRLLWTPTARQAAWAGVTRAVRTPSRVETDYTTTSLVSATGPVFVRLIPDPAFVPEKLTAYQAGYRVQPAAPMFLSLASFYNRIDDVLSTEATPAFTEPAADPVRVVIPVTFGNGLEGASYGAELSADVRPGARWRLTGSYSLLVIQLSKKPGSGDVSQERRNEGQSPRHQLQVQSSVDLPRGWMIDAFLRHISRLPASQVPAYTTFDLRAAWRATPALEVALAGQDLGQAHHLEWPSGASANIEIRRSAYLSITWRR